jgi:two-component system cell cycle sensor histidine kinase/response regulator CckA
LAAYRVNTTFAGRLEILTRALDAAFEAMLIVTPDGRSSYANIAFDQLFPERQRTPLERIKRALCPDGESQLQLRRILGRVAAGARGAGSLLLSIGPTGDAGRFEITADPIVGYPGYSYWRIRDVTARHEFEATIRGERDRLADLLDDAPIGFYSVDGSGRFRFVNRTLAKWLGSTPSEMIANGRLPDFLASPPAAGSLPFEPFVVLDGEKHSGEIVLKTCQGRSVQAWIEQNLVRSGDELRTRSVVCDLTPEREWQAALRSSERFRRCFANAPLRHCAAQSVRTL